MSVLIKGMEMPQSCYDCPLAGDFKCNLMPSIPALCKEYDMAVQNGKRLNNCPLVEIPPHGRSIDADAFIRQLNDGLPDSIQNLITYRISKMPTIIETEEGEE